LILTAQNGIIEYTENMGTNAPVISVKSERNRENE